jgi:hypothetical protein
VRNKEAKERHEHLHDSCVFILCFVEAQLLMSKEVFEMLLQSCVHSVFCGGLVVNVKGSV